MRSLDKTLLAFALLHFVLPGQPCLLFWVSLTSKFCIPIPSDVKGIFWVLVLETLTDFQRSSQLRLLWRQFLGHGLGLLWWWMVCLEMKGDHSVLFETAPKYCILDSFINYEGYSISSKGYLPTVVGIMVIWINSPIPIHFSSLMPKMLMFTLAISFLKMSNLPWFLDLTFQVLCSVVLYSIRHVFTIKHIHNWLLFPLWPSPFILSGAISNCPLVFPSSILVTFWPWAPLLGS